MASVTVPQSGTEDKPGNVFKNVRKEPQILIQNRVVELHSDNGDPGPSLDHVFWYLCNKTNHEQYVTEG